MTEQERTRQSKFLSLVLRHEPGKIGIELDSAGWTDVDALLAALQRTGRRIDRAILEGIVATDPKGRYSFSADSARIRANQGHSVAVDLELSPETPPDYLFHGTASHFLESNRRDGLLPMNRHHVHLSADEATARTVGARHGRVVVLRIDAKRLRGDGHEFFRSENGVWLTDRVPPEYLETV